MSIPLKIKSLRESKKIGVSGLASSVGVSRQAIYDYESGKTEPSLSSLQKIADALDVPVYSFIDIPHLSIQQHYTHPTDLQVWGPEEKPWFQKKIDDLEATNKQLLVQIDRLTRLLEMHLGKLDDCPHALTAHPFTEIWRNEGAVEESVEFEPLLKRA